MRVEAAMALRSFIDELDDASALKPILPQLMDSIFKLMSEVRRHAQWFGFCGGTMGSMCCRVVFECRMGCWQHAWLCAGVAHLGSTWLHPDAAAGGAVVY